MLALLLLWVFQTVQEPRFGTIQGTVTGPSGAPLEGVTVAIRDSRVQTRTGPDGRFVLARLPYGTWPLVFFYPSLKTVEASVVLQQPVIALEVSLPELQADLDEVVVRADTVRDFGQIRMERVEGFAIYAGKKSEVVLVGETSANLATNNARQVFARTVGLNIWESDGAGLQLGIGGRGLSPNRTANFNTRQNGYDIAADALGYPESYYTPPVEALERIEVVRGAAALQYGPQFGGMVNFRFRRPPAGRAFEYTGRQTVGSWNFINSFNSAGGTLRGGRVDYYGYFHTKRGDGWRPNSGFTYTNGYVSTGWQPRAGLSLRLDLTRMQYTAQQPGGLTDRQFERDPRASYRSRNWFGVDWNLAALTLEADAGPRTRLNTRIFGLHAGRQALGNLERINVADLGGERTLIDGQFRNAGLESRLVHRFKAGRQEHTLLSGVRIYRGTTRARQGDASDGTGPDFRFLNPDRLENSDYRFPNRNLAFFSEVLIQVTDRFSITPGVRYETIHTAADGYYLLRVFDNAGNPVAETRVEESTSRGRDFLLAGAGLQYEASAALDLFANVSQNYRAINFSDLRIVNPNYAVDPALRDESGFTADAGFRARAGRSAVMEASVFYIRYNDRIGQVLRTDRPPLYLDQRFRTNVADARNFGLEFYAEADFLSFLHTANAAKWTAFINTAWIDARYLNSGDAQVSGNRVEMAAPLILRSGTTYTRGRFRGSLLVSHTAAQYSDATNAERTATAVEGRIPAFTVADLTVAYRWSRIGFEASVNNLFDRRYFTRRAEAYPGPGIIPADGRGFYVTMQFML